MQFVAGSLSQNLTGNRLQVHDLPMSRRRRSKKETGGQINHRVLKIILLTDFEWDTSTSATNSMGNQDMVINRLDERKRKLDMMNKPSC